MRSRRATPRGCILALLFLVPCLAAAQEREPEDLPPELQQQVVPETPLPPGVETIEVIGEMESGADVQDKAQAITAFSADDLERANIVNIDSLAIGVPGLHVGQSGQEAIVTLRGIGTENASITGEPGVAFHVDGVNFAQPAAARVAFFDLEMLDVKLGPQGLTGGKNSTSGTINVVTKKPTDEYAVDGDVTVGNYDRVRLRGAVNVPFGEIGAARVAFFQEKRDGFLDNKNFSTSHDPFDADDFGLRGHLRLNPADSVELLFSYNYFQQGGNGPQSDLVPIHRDHIPCSSAGANVVNPFPNDDAGPSVMPALARCNRQVIQPAVPPVCTRNPITGRVTCTPFKPEVLAFIPAAEDPDPRATYSNFGTSQDNRFWGWTTHLDWDVPAIPQLGETQLKLLGGFQDSRQTFDYDSDGTDLDFTNLFTGRGATQYSSELQWSGMLGERLEWQTGGLWARETGYRDLWRPQTTYSGSAPDTNVTQDTDNESYSTWLSGTYTATDSLTLSLGGRWIKDEKSTYLLRSVASTSNSGLETFTGCTGFLGFNVDPVTLQNVPASPNPWCSATYRGTMWGAGAEWRPWGSDDHLLFARIDRGRKSGGFRAGGRGEYLPEKNWAYSAGSKSTFFDGRLQFNLDGFVYLYTDMQLVVLDELVLRTENTDARMYGWDMKATATPFEGMRLDAMLSSLHTETIDYFSLDPANQISATASVSDPIVADNSARLYARYLAETYAAGQGGTYVDSTECLTPPPNQVQGYRCGLTGDKDGLDDFSGNRLPRAPSWKLTLAAEYELPLGAWGSLTPRVQYAWQDDTYFRAFNKDFDLQESYHQTDAKVIWKSPEARWEAEAFVLNIEDEAPKQNLFIGARSNGSPPVVWWGPPRFYGFRVGFKY